MGFPDGLQNDTGIGVSLYAPNGDCVPGSHGPCFLWVTALSKVTGLAGTHSGFSIHEGGGVKPHAGAGRGRPGAQIVFWGGGKKC
jgi:hypothetical protein